MENKELERLYKEHEKYIDITINRNFNSPSFWNLHGLTREDLQQHGRIGLYEACKTYNPNMSTEFKSYAISRIYWNISNECKSESLSRGSVWNFDVIDRTSLDKTIPSDSGEDMTLQDTIADEFDYYEEFTMEDNIETIKKEITPRVAEIVKLKLKGCTNVDISETLGVSHQYISNLLRKNKSEIKNILLAE